MYRKLAISALIGTFAIAGDVLVDRFDKYRHIRALTDNLTHATVGALTWITVLLYRKLNIVPQLSNPFLFEVFVCALLSSLIDVDHFIEARSLKLQDVLLLKSRPFLHCTSLLIAASLLIVGLSFVLKNQTINTFGWISLAAVLSHHTRDATRRGFWCFPFGSSPPINYWLYIFCVMSIPHLIAYLLIKTRISQKIIGEDSIPLII